MLNTLLFGIAKQFDSAMGAISAANPFLSYRNSLFDRVKAENTIQAVLAFGAGAQHAVSLSPGRLSLTLYSLTHPTATSGVTALESSGESVRPALLL
jgi:hypothetical protein